LDSQVKWLAGPSSGLPWVAAASPWEDLLFFYE
jgi:hypothetical protein